MGGLGGERLVEILKKSSSELDERKSTSFAVEGRISMGRRGF